MFQLVRVDQNYNDTKAYLCKENNLNIAINHELARSLSLYFIFY